MSIKQTDIKLLWGKSANRCALCKTELSMIKEDNNDFLIGEQAHIVGEKQTAARGESDLTDKERNCYDNLILLCPNDHSVIDKNPEDYSVEKLHSLKSEHEYWVATNLSNSYDLKLEATELVYANLIDSVVVKGNLHKWDIWTSYVAFSPPERVWEEKMIDYAFELVRIVKRAIFPGVYPDLEKAITTTALALNGCAQIFSEHSLPRGEYRFEHKYHKDIEWDPGRYAYLVEKYNKWISNTDEAMVLLCKSLNWFADEVRKNINPLFFVEKGKFILTVQDALKVYDYVPEFTDEEKREMPENLHAIFNKLMKEVE